MDVRRSAAIVLGAALAVLAPFLPTSGPTAYASPPGSMSDPDAEQAATRPDFNGDGYADLAIGTPQDGSAGFKYGTVTVLYGGVAAMTPDPTLWSQAAAGIPGGEEDGDAFGTAVTFGDFDGDGYDDLAAGSPGESVGTLAAAGAVNVIYGSASGLTATGAQLWYQDVTDVLDTSEQDDEFGAALVGRDIDGDGYGDLVVGVPGEDARAGAIQVFFGTANGLTADRDQLLRQPGAGQVEAGDAFGSSLSAGDYDDDGYRDVAVGAPLEDVGDEDLAGAVSVLRGGPDGLSAARGTTLDRDSKKVAGNPGFGATFGWALTSEDLDLDGRVDLVVGAGGQKGSVQVFSGTAKGINGSRDELVTQQTYGLDNKPFDGFGSAVAVGFFDGDGYPDVAIGIPYEDAESGFQVVPNVGAVAVVSGMADGLGDLLDYLQPPVDFEDPTSSGESYGSSLAAGDFLRPGFTDLAVGVPYRDLGDYDQGAVEVLPGGSSGFGVAKEWHQDSPGVPGVGGPEDHWGAGLVSR